MLLCEFYAEDHTVPSHLLSPSTWIKKPILFYKLNILLAKFEWYKRSKLSKFRIWSVTNFQILYIFNGPFVMRREGEWF